MTMNNHFLFGKDLSGPSQEELKENGIFSQEDIEIAHKEGFIEGFERGQKQAFDDIQAQTLTILSSLEHTLSRVLETEERSKTLDHTITISQKLIKAILPRFIKEGALEEVKACCEEVISKLTTASVLTITCSPVIKDSLTQLLQPLCDEKSPILTLAIKENSSFQMTDIDMDWSSGAAWRREKEVINDLDNIILQFMENNS